MHITQVTEGVRFNGTDWNGGIIRAVHIDHTNIISGRPIRFPIAINPGNTGFNVLIEDCQFNDVPLVTHFANIGGVTIEQMYFKYKNCLFIRITDPNGFGLVEDTPNPEGEYLIELDGNIMTESDNHYSPGFLDSLGGMANRVAAGSFHPAIPGNNVETPQLGSELPGAINPEHYSLANPPSGIPIGENNIAVSELDLTPIYNRPLLDELGQHPAVGTQFGAKGHSGASYPAGDFNENNVIDHDDYFSFRDTMFDPNPSPTAMSFADFDGNDVVNMADFAIFLSGFTGVQPNCDGIGPGDFESVVTEQDLFNLTRLNAPTTPIAAVASTRFLSVLSNGQGLLTAIRVTPVAMPQGYENLIGRSMFLGPLEEIGEGGSSKEPVEGLGTFFASSLQCSPVYADWGSTDIKVTGAMIIPGGEYLIQNLGDGCVATIEANFSASLQVETSVQRGDILSQAGPPGDGTNIDDVLGVLSGFSSAPGAPSKYRTDMEPAVIDFKINISDALDALAGFSGLPYSRPGPEPCS